MEVARTCTEQEEETFRKCGWDGTRTDRSVATDGNTASSMRVVSPKHVSWAKATCSKRSPYGGDLPERSYVHPFGSRRGAWKTRRCKGIVGRVRVQASVDRRCRASRLRRSHPRRRAMAFERSLRPGICTNVPRATVRIFEPHKVHLTDGPGGPEGQETTVRLRSIRDPPRGDSIRHHRVGSSGVRGRATQAETPSTQRGTRSGRGGASSMPRDKRRRSRWTGVQGRI